MNVIPSRRDAFWALVDTALERNGHAPATAAELVQCLPFTDPEAAARRVLVGRDINEERAA